MACSTKFHLVGRNEFSFMTWLTLETTLQFYAEGSLKSHELVSGLAWSEPKWTKLSLKSFFVWVKLWVSF